MSERHEPKTREGKLPRAVAVVGPTAAGKSAVALGLAKQLRMPIRCCDSAQVYRQLDIGTAKPDARARAEVEHELLDLVDIEETFSAGRWAEEAWRVHARRPGIFVGGTGFYLRTFAMQLTEHAVASTQPQREDATSQGTASDQDPREVARERFEEMWMAREHAVPGSIHAALATIDPASAAAVHPNNKRRALRYLWLCEQAGHPISELRARQPPVARAQLLLLVVDPGVAEVDDAIARRCAEMIAGGWIEEVRDLLAAGRTGDEPGLRTIGYLQLVAHLRGAQPLSAATDAIVAVTRAYARRQRTYLRTQFPGARQIFIRDPKALDSSGLADTVCQFLDCTSDRSERTHAAGSRETESQP